MLDDQALIEQVSAADGCMNTVVLAVADGAGVGARRCFDARTRSCGFVTGGVTERVKEGGEGSGRSMTDRAGSTHAGIPVPTPPAGPES
jgi:hypothetical protein